MVEEAAPCREREESWIRKKWLEDLLVGFQEQSVASVVLDLFTVG